MSFAKRETLVALLMILPTLALYTVFYYYPLVLSIYFSFTRWSLTGSPKWIGLENYIRLFQDRFLRDALVVTVEYVVAVVTINLVLGIALALLLNRPTKLAALTRALIFLPVVIPEAAAASTWIIMFAPGPYGYINYLLTMMGYRWLKWFDDPSLALPMVVLYSIWKNVGFNTLVFYSALKSIPREYIESAQVDGASEWDISTKIIMPLLKPITAFLLVTSIITAWQVFGSVYIITKGGPGNSTRVLGIYLYEVAFEEMRAGYGSAIAVFMTALILGLTIVQLKKLR